MKNKKLHIGQSALAIVFTLLIFFPIGIQASHALNKHQHKICNDFENHLHQTQLDCNICDFHFSTFSFIPASLPVGVEEIQVEKRLNFASDFTLENFLVHFYLRGPPRIS